MASAAARKAGASSGRADATPPQEGVVEVTPSDLELVGQGIDVQIATARRFPRDLQRFRDYAMALATEDEDASIACIYAMPRDGGFVSGPSARLAEICAHAWGNARVASHFAGETDRYVAMRSVAWDLESNTLVGFECRRRIVDRNGLRYSDDLIGVTANAAGSIALRNAIFKMIPQPFWYPIYQACRLKAVGDEKTLEARRERAIEHFRALGVAVPKILQVLGVRSTDKIGIDHIILLRGLATAIRDHDTTVDAVFGVRQRAEQDQGAGAAPPAIDPAELLRSELGATPEQVAQVLAHWERRRVATPQRIVEIRASGGRVETLLATQAGQPTGGRQPKTSAAPTSATKPSTAAPARQAPTEPEPPEPSDEDAIRNLGRTVFGNREEPRKAPAPVRRSNDDVSF